MEPGGDGLPPGEKLGLRRLTGRRRRCGLRRTVAGLLAGAREDGDARRSRRLGRSVGGGGTRKDGEEGRGARDSEQTAAALTGRSSGRSRRPAGFFRSGMLRRRRNEEGRQDGARARLYSPVPVHRAPGARERRARARHSGSTTLQAAGVLQRAKGDKRERMEARVLGAPRGQFVPARDVALGSGCSGSTRQEKGRGHGRGEELRGNREERKGVNGDSG